jgi:hypothetical protein
MDANPGVVFRDGPGGRRAGLAGGPDVWEAIRVLRDVPGTDEQRIHRIAELTDLSVHPVRASARYYRNFPKEIDGWIDAVDREAEEPGALPAARG